MDSISLNFRIITEALQNFATSSVSTITDLAKDIFKELNNTPTIPLYAVAALTLVSHLYEGYTSKPQKLDESIKLVKCKILLKQIENTDKDIQPLLQECETLLLSLKEPYADKNLIFQLALQFARTNPDKSYELANQLTSYDDLYRAAFFLHEKQPQFDPSKLVLLLQKALKALNLDKALKALNLDNDPHLYDVNFYVKILQASHQLRANALTDETIIEAFKFINSLKKDKLKLYARCEIVKVCHKLGVMQKDFIDAHLKVAAKLLENLEVMDKFHGRCEIAKAYHEIGEKEETVEAELNAIAELIANLESKEDLAKAQLSLAKLFLSLGKNKKAQEIVNSEIFVDLLKNREAPLDKAELDLIDKISSDEKILNLFQNSKDIMIKRVDKTFESLKQKKVDSDTFSSLIKMIRFYTTLKLPEKTKEVALFTFENLGDIKLTSEHFSYIFNYFPYKEFSEQIQTRFDSWINTLYETCDDWEKSLTISYILSFYKKMNLTEKVDQFSEKYMVDRFKLDSKRLFGPITILTIDGVREDLSQEQKIKNLAQAEQLLLKVDPCLLGLNTASIASAYLKVDIQKSIQVIEDYEKRIKLQSEKKRNLNYLKGAITAIAMIALSFNVISSGTLFFTAVFINTHTFYRTLT